MKARKILVSLAALALVAAISIGGTLAYLTSSKQVTNTFTVGNVSIKLTETEVDADGKKVQNDGQDVRREQGNSYNLLPNHEYSKDPMVTVLANSEESYVRMKVTFTFNKKLSDETLAMNLDNIFTGYDAKVWPRANKEVQTLTKNDGTTQYTVITYEYRYAGTVAKQTSDKDLEPLFTNVKIPNTWTNDDLAAIGAFNIDIVAEAIQADGFKDAADAWSNFPA